MSSDQGNARRALRDERAGLRARIAKSPAGLSARARLAETYRAEGYLDQAGRWGLLVPGGTTANERQMFARVVSPKSESTTERVRHLLLVLEGQPIEQSHPDGHLANLSATLREESATLRPLRPGQNGAHFDAGEIALIFGVIPVSGVRSRASSSSSRCCSLRTWTRSEPSV